MARLRLYIFSCAFLNVCLPAAWSQSVPSNPPNPATIQSAYTGSGDNQPSNNSVSVETVSIVNPKTAKPGTSSVVIVTGTRLAGAKLRIFDHDYPLDAVSSDRKCEASRLLSGFRSRSQPRM